MIVLGKKSWTYTLNNSSPFFPQAYADIDWDNRNAGERLQWKLTVAKRLYQRGYSRQDMLELLV